MTEDIFREMTCLVCNLTQLKGRGTLPRGMQTCVRCGVTGKWAWADWLILQSLRTTQQEKQDPKARELAWQSDLLLRPQRTIQGMRMRADTTHHVESAVTLLTQEYDWPCTQHFHRLCLLRQGQISDLLWEWNLKNNEKVDKDFQKTLEEVQKYFAYTAIYTERAPEVEKKWNILK